MDKQACPMCGKKFVDILKHFTLQHDINNIEQLKNVTEIAETQEQKKKEFGTFIRDLNEKLSKKEITMEEWKLSRDDWQRKND